MTRKINYVIENPPAGMPDPRCAGIVWVETHSTECSHYFVEHEDQDFPGWIKFVCRECGSIMYNISSMPNVEKAGRAGGIGIDWMPAQSGFKRLSTIGDGF